MKKRAIITIAASLVILATLSFGGLVWYSSNQMALAKAPPVPTRTEVLKLVNAERAKNGVAPLVENANLDTSAQMKSDDMTLNHYEAHIMPSTGTVVNKQMSDLIYAQCTDASENYSWSTGSKRTAADALNGWMHSPPHRAAILNPSYSLTGFGISSGDKLTIVEHFCKQ